MKEAAKKKRTKEKAVKETQELLKEAEVSTEQEIEENVPSKKKRVMSSGKRKKKKNQ